MKRAADALRSLSLVTARHVGLEGSFLVIGVVALSIAASFFHPAGPWIVVGLFATVIGIALTAPRRAG